MEEIPEDAIITPQDAKAVASAMRAGLEMARLGDKLERPAVLRRFGDEYSNFDHTVPEGAEAALRSGRFFVQHPAWDHHGDIWFADGQFHEQVHRYGVHVATVSSDSLIGVFEAVNAQFGGD